MDKHLHFLSLFCITVGGSLLLSTSTAYAFNTTGTPATASSTPVMSPTDFSNKVSTLKQQTKDSLAAEAKQLLNANSNSSPLSTTNTAGVSNNNVPTAQPSAPPASSNTTPSFSGFGNSGSKPPSSNSGQGNWSIKY